MTDGPETASAGWYADPAHPGQERWWDGQKWSGTRRAPESAPLTPTVIPASPGAPRPNPFAGAGRPRARAAGGTPPRAAAGSENPNPLANVGFLLAVVGIVVSAFGVVSLAGAIVSLLALVRARHLAAEGTTPTGHGRALAGAVIGGICFVGWLVIWLVVIVVIVQPGVPAGG